MTTIWYHTVVPVVVVSGRVEPYVRSRAGRIIGVEHGSDRVLVDHRLGDRGLDALTGPICEVLINQLRRVGAAGAAQISAIEPFADDPLQLPEQV